jgi:hypothetical protein
MLAALPLFAGAGVGLVGLLIIILIVVLILKFA